MRSLFSWFKGLFSTRKPKARLNYEDGKLVIEDYNRAFVDKLRNDLGDLTLGKTDAQVVKLYLDRENLEHEEPKLTVEHMGIDKTGKIKMKLDWNQAFIRLLRDKAGIVSENEEEAIQAYLLRLSMDVAEDMGLPNQLTLTQDQVNGALEGLDGDYAQEMAETEEMSKKLPHRKGRRTYR